MMMLFNDLSSMSMQPCSLGYQKRAALIGKTFSHTPSRIPINACIEQRQRQPERTPARDIVKADG